MEGGGKEGETKRWILREMEGWKDVWMDGLKEGRVEGLVERGVGWAGSPYPAVCQGSQRCGGLYLPCESSKEPSKRSSVN